MLPVADLGVVRVGVVKYVERAVAVADVKRKCLPGLGVADHDRDVAIAGVPEQQDEDAIAGAAVQLARRRRDAAAVGAD